MSRCCLFNILILFCVRVFNWKAQHIVTVPWQRHWHWYCQTQSYLHFERCIWMTSIEPLASRLWETRAGYREMPIQIRAVDVMAGGECGAGPAPSIRHQEPGRKAGTWPSWFGICTQTFRVIHILCLVSVFLQCSGNACEQYAEDFGFEICLHLFWTQVCTGMSWYVLVCTSMYQNLPGCTGTCIYVPVWGYYELGCTGLYL